MRQKIMLFLSRVIGHDWTKILAILGTIWAASLAAEHRISVIEADQAKEIEIRQKEQKAETEARLQREAELWKTIKDLQSAMKMFGDQHEKMLENQIRVVTLLEQIDKRHYIEDIREGRTRPH